jgi:hypothetical protein
MNRLLIFVAALSCAAACPALAEQYWIAYEGDDFPENEGWTRVYCDSNGVPGQGGAVRTIEDGALVLDSLESVMIVDFYEVTRAMDPDAGEVFVMGWRARFDEVFGNDPGVGVFSDEYRAAAFSFSETGLQSVFEPGAAVSFAGGEFHSFELRSADMLAYELFVDGLPALSGEFTDVFQASRVSWGDGTQGGRSLARWDYFRFGVVPEPGMLWMLALGCAMTALRATRHTYDPMKGETR